MMVILFILSVFSCSGCNNASDNNPSVKNAISATPKPDTSQTARYQKAYNQGVQEALREIKKDSLTYYEYGEEPDYPYNVETGLPAKIVAGCIINDSVIGYVEGHNQTIRNHLQSLIKDDEVLRATSHLDSTFNTIYRKSYYQGMQEAYTEIKNNKITRYVYGKGNWGDIDKETGVLIKIIAGCIVSDSIIGRADGHNYIILKYLKHEIK